MKNDQKSTFSYREFFASARGELAIAGICYLVLFGTAAALWSGTKSVYTPLIVQSICAVFGWRVLNRIQPAMFLWMSWVGWLIYFFIKFFLSAIIGIFVAPYKIGRWIAETISNSLQ